MLLQAQTTDAVTMWSIFVAPSALKKHWFHCWLRLRENTFLLARKRENMLLISSQGCTSGLWKHLMQFLVLAISICTPRTHSHLPVWSLGFQTFVHPSFWRKLRKTVQSVLMFPLYPLILSSSSYHVYPVLQCILAVALYKGLYVCSRIALTRQHVHCTQVFKV